MTGFFWLLLTFVFLMGEIMIPGLVSIWFGLAAGIVTLISKYIEPPIYQFYLFVLLSAIFLFFSRPFSRKLLGSRSCKLENRILGQMVVVKAVLDDGRYEVMLDGKHWKAVCSEKLELGGRGKVLRIEGIKLILEKE